MHAFSFPSFFFNLLFELVVMQCPKLEMLDYRNKTLDILPNGMHQYKIAVCGLSLNFSKLEVFS